MAGNEMLHGRNWTVLLIGGASGVGKTSIARQLSLYYQVNALQVDDIGQALKASTTGAVLPALHYWSTGVDWKDIGVSANVDWLINVSKEMIPALTAIINNHLEDEFPIIIEGDFIHPEFAVSFANEKVRSLFVLEMDRDQIIQNYLAREGGSLQEYRADISVEYGMWILNTCKQLGIELIEARPWDTALARAVK